jgi:uncharacterized pyridoxamine 5'-phosphate oxidase family protein
LELGRLVRYPANDDVFPQNGNHNILDILYLVKVTNEMFDFDFTPLHSCATKKDEENQT